MRTPDEPAAPTPAQEAASRRSARSAALIISLVLTASCVFFGVVGRAVVLPALRALEEKGEQAPAGR